MNVHINVCFYSQPRDLIKVNHPDSCQCMAKPITKMLSNYPPIKTMRYLYIYTAATAKSLQSCPTLRDPLDCSLPGSSIHGIFQARVLEWGATGPNPEH